MNQEQKTKVVSQLQPFWDLDIDKHIAETYKDFTDLSSVVISYYTVTELSTYSKKMISQLGLILETPMANILPLSIQFSK